VAGALQPATKLFAAFLFIEILVTAIQYMTDQGDAPRYIGRLFRHLFSAGFIYLMLINAFPWMTGVMKSFSAIGAAVSGVPNLSPSTVLDLGGQMAETIYNTPASTGMIPNFSMALGQTVAAFFILLSFTIIAALALLVVIEMYLVVGGASILLAFGGSRFTAPIAEGYFGYVIKAGVRLLFFYLVLGIGVKIATEWNSALVAACVPATTWRTCSSVRTCASFMSITIESMIDTPRMPAPCEPAIPKSQTPSRLIPRWNLAPGSRLTPRWTRLSLADSPGPNAASQTSDSNASSNPSLRYASNARVWFQPST